MAVTPPRKGRKTLVQWKTVSWSDVWLFRFHLERKHGPNDPANPCERTASLALCLKHPVKKVAFSVDPPHGVEGAETSPWAQPTVLRASVTSQQPGANPSDSLSLQALRGLFATETQLYCHYSNRMWFSPLDSQRLLPGRAVRQDGPPQIGPETVGWTNKHSEVL